MIISCEKCNKKFELADHLIPSEGRLLQCGSCGYQWTYTPASKIELVNEVMDNVESNNEVKKSEQKTIKKIKKKNKTSSNLNIHQSYSEDPATTQKKIGFFSLLLVIIISLISLVIFLDTFKNQLTGIIPHIDFYLDSLYDTLKDIYLFFVDLIK